MKSELSDDLILIRPFRAGDVELIYQAVRESISEISKWMIWCSEDYSRNDAFAFFISRDEAWINDLEYSFGIFERASDAFLGSVGLNFVVRAYQMANLGYWVKTTETRRGVASRAVRLAACFGFEQLQLQRIEIIAAVGNIPSQRVAEKAGATREGVMRKRLVRSGKSLDAVMFSLVAEDLAHVT
jgi:RimJ/RimL family protein N-acetyltransferase